MRYEKPEGELRKGWTTGACATAAVKAAYMALLKGAFPNPVSITLPKGEQPSFPLAVAEKGEGWARLGVDVIEAIPSNSPDAWLTVFG